MKLTELSYDNEVPRGFLLDPLKLFKFPYEIAEEILQLKVKNILIIKKRF